MERILQAFGDIADVLPRLDRLKATFPEDLNFNQVVGLIYSDVIEFHRRAYKFFRRKAWHFWFAFDWGLFERRFKLILQKLDCHCERLDKEAAAAHYSKMKEFRDKRQREEDDLERQRQTQMAQDVFRWLSAAEDQQEEFLHQISDKRQPGTCDWVLKDPQMQPWIEDDSGDAVLWMTGIPGAGKSFLCSLLVENLQSQQRLSSLYYFCSQSPSTITCAIILRTLAYQLLQQNLDMASLVHQAYLQTGSTRSGPAMKKLLTQLLPNSKTARIIIDGIDEGDRATQQEILRSLIDIQKSAGHHCKLLVSSREEPQIQKLLAAKVHLKLGEQTLGGLGLYIKDRIKTLHTDNPLLDSALMSLAEQRLSSKAKGMFLWVRLVTDMLSDQMSEQGFENAIDQLPEGLDEAYGVIQSRIDSRPPILRQRAFTILYWVCVARRPISLDEVTDGIALRSGQMKLSRTTRSLKPREEFIGLCAPLLEISKNGVLDLVHFSAKEYFIHQHSGPFIDLAEAHLSLAMSSIINLTSCLDFVPGNTSGISQRDLESRVVQGCYGLQSYGQEFWAEHVLAYLEKVGVDGSISKDLLRSLKTFSQVWKRHTHTDTALPSTLHAAEASLGLTRLHAFPILHRFISGWLYFKSDYNRNLPSLNTFEAQKEWRLRKDETFLSLIDSQLSIITEQLLMMDSSLLPSHIDENDFKYFVSRFRFLCRFQGCSHVYGRVEERDTHEKSHVLFFPCLQCDFSGRGFRSRKDLEKHTQKYHMSAEDFEVPDTLHTVGPSASSGIADTSGAFRVSFSRSGHWSERGRKALRQGFHHVLAKLESEMGVSTGDDGNSNSKEMNHTEIDGHGQNQYETKIATMVGLESIRHHVDDQGYESLTDFKDDLGELFWKPATASTSEGDGRLESIFDDEIEKAMSAFPAFANFNHHDAKEERMRASGSDRLDPGQSILDAADQDDDTTSQGHLTFGTRVPYWSLPEQTQFPELIQRYGRDFVKIADHLKTKTPKEVDEHFRHLVRTGNTDLSDLVDLAEANIQRETDTTGSTTDSSDSESEMRAPDELGSSSMYYVPSSQLNAGPYVPQFRESETSLTQIHGTANQSGTNLGAGEHIDGPIRKKRRAPPKALCPYCSKHKEGLRDEYALKRHIERFHMATRKVWICEDISIDKRFLLICKACSANKRYSSRNNAGKHLRSAHFSSETSAETLQRWMREIEEPNPSSTNVASTIRPAVKLQKKGGKTFSLPPVKYHPDSSRVLPSTIFETNSLRSPKPVLSSEISSSIEDNMDGDKDGDARDVSLSSPEDESSEDIDFPEDISFDNFLPGNINTPRLLNDNERPYRTNRALISPDQILKLPNLSSFQKTACLDQVHALYQRLDNAYLYSLEYKQALESLASLSRVLMRNLRDWRRHSALAPHIPFSI